MPPDASRGRTHFLYPQYVNRLHGRSGHLWQNRFYSCALDDEHLWNTPVYVERNPVRARRVRVARNWCWSSAAAHVGEASPGGLPALTDRGEQRTPAKWRNQLAHKDEEAAAERLPRQTMSLRMRSACQARNERPESVDWHRSA